MNSFPSKRVIVVGCAVAVFHLLLRAVPDDVALVFELLGAALFALWALNAVLRFGFFHLVSMAVYAGVEKLDEIELLRRQQLQDRAARRRALSEKVMYAAH
jgi:hypothetical protein